MSAPAQHVECPLDPCTLCEGRQVAAMYAHQASGLEAMSGSIRARSGELFAAGRDEEARVYRSIAEWVKEKAVENRKRQAQAEAELGE